MKASLIAHRMTCPARLGGSIFTISLRKDKNYMTVFRNGTPRVRNLLFNAQIFKILGSHGTDPMLCQKAKIFQFFFSQYFQMLKAV
jgi:hypothetical protein